MLLNHLIIGVLDLQASADCYCHILGYQQQGTFTDTGTGNQGWILSHPQGPEILLVPFKTERLPNPQHIAFEVDATEFGAILERCQSRKIRVRPQSPLQHPESGVGEHQQSGIHYKHFFLCDPTNINIEIMTQA